MSAPINRVRDGQADRRERRTLVACSSAPQVASTEHRLIVGPANSAGQGFRWGRAIVEANPKVSAANFTMVTERTYPYPTDLEVPLRVYKDSLDWSRAFEDSIRSQFTHALWESGRPPLGLAARESAWAQIERLASVGVKPAFVAHGSDVRVPSVHAEQFPWSPFRDTTHELTQALEKKTRVLHSALANFSGERFVSTPDLLDSVPDARWLPVVVAPGWFGGPRLRLARRSKVRIGHVSSNSMIKRSDDIERQIEPLVASGAAEYVRISGVEPRNMPRMVRSCDVIVDQFGMGSYGVAACEAMAAGRVVVGNVTDVVRGIVKEQTGHGLPIVQSELEDLSSVLEDVIADPARIVQLGADGERFVKAVHSGPMSAAVLEHMFLNVE